MFMNLGLTKFVLISFNLLLIDVNLSITMLNYVLPIEIVYSALISNFALTLCSMRQVICCVALVDDDSLDIAPCTLPIAGECADVGLTAYMSSFELRMACLLTSVRTIFLTLD